VSIPAARSRTATAFELGLLSNRFLLAAVAASALLQLGVVFLPFVQPFFGVKAIPSAEEWGLIVTLAVLPAALIELGKVAYCRLMNQTSSVSSRQAAQERPQTRRASPLWFAERRDERPSFRAHP
jgi:magnesium-transporting ATPase (P-type)